VIEQAVGGIDVGIGKDRIGRRVILQDLLLRGVPLRAHRVNLRIRLDSQFHELTGVKSAVWARTGRTMTSDSAMAVMNIVTLAGNFLSNCM
jgi:hypothetical protein